MARFARIDLVFTDELLQKSREKDFWGWGWWRTSDPHIANSKNSGILEAEGA